MRTSYLRIFNAFLVAMISLLGFTNCAKKTYPQEKIDNFQTDSIKNSEELNDSPRIIVKYGAPAPDFRQK
ncbi:MAG: hypothetical protein LBN27_08155 [Prevotellaceae bacterium]|jgi:hypothetical protein|nr:hypothetical protein [Prevotellaceae bacterium]